MKKIFLILGLIFIFSKAHSFSHFDDTTIYTVVERMPEFQGGGNALLKYLAKNILIPEEEANSFNGKIYISFIVEKNGSLSNIIIKKGGSEKYNDTLIKVIKDMPPWTPGVHQGKVVRCQMNIPINICFSR